MLAYFGHEDNKFQSNTMGATTDAGTAHLSVEPEFTPLPFLTGFVLLCL